MAVDGKLLCVVRFSENVKVNSSFRSSSEIALEDIYSSEEIVDQQPVVVRVMDTYDQV